MGKRKRLTSIFIFFLVLQQSIFALLNLTPEEISYIKRREPVRAVSVDGAGPIQYTDSKGEIKGVAVDVLKEIEKRTGLTFTYTLLEKMGQFDSVYSDGTDILFGIPDQYARPNYKLSTPFMYSHTILYLNTDVNAQELKNKRFAATYGSALPEGIREDQAIYFQSREEAIKAVDSGLADFGYGNAYSLAFYTLQHGLRNIYTIPQGKEERAYRILFINDDPLLISIIEKALASFNPYELNNIILEATSQVERIITPSLVIGTYGKEIFTATFFIIGLLIIALVIVLNSHKKLNFQRKKYMAISEVSNEYLFEYSSLHKTLHLSNKFKTLFSTQTTLKAAQNTLISTLASLPIEESEVIELNLPSGKMHTFLLSAIKVSKQRSGTKTWIGKLLDISEEKAKQKHLENLAQKDGLTDLLNASTTRHQIEKRLTQKLPEERDFCILFDLDDFKAVNDSGGHLVGDRVLQTIGEIMLQTQSSTLDILGRVGGDEFCIYLIDVPSYETVISYCTSLLEIVRSRLQEEGVTISLGVVEVQKGETYEELYTRVDNALYTSKANGKNRMEIM